MEAQVERVREIFDAWAAAGRAEGMENGHGPTARPGFDALDLAGRGPGLRYLDIGCGNGYTVRWACALPNVKDAVGVDVAPNMIERARALTADLPQAQFHELDFAQTRLPTPLEPQSFDGIFSMEVFYYLPDLSHALRQCLDLLRPRGRFACVVDYYDENPASHSWPEELGCEMHRLTMQQWREAFTDAGFRVVDQGQLRREAADGVKAWKVETGSLLTLGERP